eukprot:CAMPEP_0184493186 /NCGR_PEP_ID=MMETSP0113_2-20130426/25351_1 /TAXON_ID=91329 /ORGANISM="Norrisiella sphaerica, Strain BC52" /LENGTH=441 /DNA_ID=CAMNT_0026878371 /DNA_START=215 /DNA_END=1537 /DNA_ORIENTATION=+
MKRNKTLPANLCSGSAPEGSGSGYGRKSLQLYSRVQHEDAAYNIHESYWDYRHAKSEPLLRRPPRTFLYLETGERWSNGGWRTVASMFYCLSQFFVAVPDAVLGPTLTALGQQVSCADEGEICPEMLEAISWNRTGAAISVGLAWIISTMEINGHYVLAVGFSMISISFLTCSFSTTPQQVHISFFFIGLGKGLTSLYSTALMVSLRQNDPKKLSKWVNLLSIFWGLGSIFTPLLVSLSTMKDFRLSFFTVGLLCFSLTIVAVFLRSKVPDKEQRRQFLASNRRDENNVEELQPLSEWRANIVMILGYMFAFVSIGVEFNIVAYITPYVESRKIASNTIGNFITTSYSVAFMVGRILIGILEVKGFPPALILNACMLIATALAAFVTYFSTSIAAIWIGAVGWGALLSPSWPLTILLLRQTGEVSECMVQLFVFAIYSGQW